MLQSSHDMTNQMWWVAVDNETTGPYGTGYIIAAVRSQVINAGQLICLVGEDNWQPLSQYPQFRRHLPTSASPQITSARDREPSPGSIPTTILPLFQVDWRQVGAAYGLVVNPILWIVTVAGNILFAYGSPSDSPSTDLDAVIGLVWLLSSVALLVSWVLAGWWLYHRKRIGLWLAIGSGVLSQLRTMLLLVALIVAIAAGDQFEAPPNTGLQNILTAMFLLIGLLDLGFQLVLVIGLWWNRQSVDLFT